MPKPEPMETLKHFVARYAKSKEAQASFPDQKQRVAVAYATWARRPKGSQ